MPYKLRSWTCPDCGKPHLRRAPAGPPPRCHECSIAYAAEVARQMHTKSGEAYERWAFAWVTAGKRVARSIMPETVRRAG